MKPASRIFAFTSLIIAFTFAAVSLLLYPIWEDVSNFLSTSFPVMFAASILGGLCAAGILYLLEASTVGKVWQYVLFSLLDLVMVGLLGYLLYGLGTERALLYRQAVKYLPYALWFSAIVLYVWFSPRWGFLQTWTARLALMGVLAVSALIWANLPLTVAMTSRPVVFLQGDGVVVAWGTNMTATGKVEYSQDDHPVQVATGQVGGLTNLGRQIVRVFIPLSPASHTLNLTATSRGIKEVKPTSIKEAGMVTSETVSINFPARGEPISFVSFSDLHEQADIYEQLSASVPWDEMNLAVFNGDHLNSTMDAPQVTRSILNLPTGNRDMPRVFARGNHETRAASARQLSGWLLPNGGRWYQSFNLGNTFFVILDSGEDKNDSHQEYGGLVDFAVYHKEQAAWLQDVLNSQEFHQAQYHVVLLHIPLFGESKAPSEFEPVATMLRENKDIDLMLNGHTHDYGISLPDETGLPYPVAFSGGPETDTAAAVIVRMGKDTLGIQIIDANGTSLAQYP